MTLGGQPAEYWTCGYSAVRESNPLAVRLLSVHSLAFATGVPYVLLVTAAISALPWRWSVIAVAAVSLSHVVGVVDWTAALSDESPGLAALPASAALLLVAWRRWGQKLDVTPRRGQPGPAR